MANEALELRRLRDAIDRVRAAAAGGGAARPSDLRIVIGLLDESLLELGLRRLADQAWLASAARTGQENPE